MERKHVAVGSTKRASIPSIRNRGLSGLASTQSRYPLSGCSPASPTLFLRTVLQYWAVSYFARRLSMNDRLQTMLRQLRLSGLGGTLDVRLQEAGSHQLSHIEFLELILQDELLVRKDRQISRRVQAALFRDHKPLDEFDWSFNPGIPKKQLYELATGRFIRESRDVLFLGPPGVGKSFLVQAIGH